MSQNKFLFWRGCTYRNQLPEELKNTEEVLQRLGIRFKTIEEKCCGYPLYLAGYLKETRELAAEVSNVLKSFKLVVTACPACLRSFKEVYQGQLNMELPLVLHLTQFLAEKGALDNAKFKVVNMKVMYHDPCELGRELGVYEEPRKLLNLVPGLKIFEQRFTRESSACCGGGGLLPAFSPSIASMEAARKLTQEDKVPADLDAVVTTCPQCVLNMRRGLQMWVEDEALKKIRVLDLTQLLSQALGD